MRLDLKSLNRETLLNLLEDLAKTNYDGHVTLMRFTTHWKVMFGTPSLVRTDDNGSSEVSHVPAHFELANAIRLCLECNTKV